MKKILLINAHHPYPFSEGELNKSLCNIVSELAREKGMEVRSTKSSGQYDVEEELEKHQWADLIVLQTPVNWMGVPWSFKKYMDEVYTAGMAGQLCNGDGRHSDEPKKNYGTGGALTGKQYMLSLTFNAPEEAFNNSEEYLFQGKNVDDLFFPMHMTFRFFGMTSLETFACYDVMKNPQAEKDMERYKQHLNSVLD